MVATIRFEDGPAADASGATIMCSNAGIRITFRTCETRYYYGLGAHIAESATICFGTIPELQWPDAPKPSAELQAKYKNRHMGVGAVGRAKISVGGGTATGAVAAGAVGCVFKFDSGSWHTYSPSTETNLLFLWHIV